MKIIFYILISQILSIGEKRIDLKKYTSDKQSMAIAIRDVQLNNKFNLALPYTEEWFSLMKELFYNQIGENSIVKGKLTIAFSKNVKIGKEVIIMNGALMMAAGGITIEDKVLIGANVKLISNNQYPYERDVLLCKPILIREGASIGAGSTILPGVTVGKYAIIGSDSVVTKDVPDYSVAVGNPAKIIKYLEKNGKSKEYDYFDGNLIYEGEFLKGIRNGKGKEFNKEGKLIFEGEYLNGEKLNEKEKENENDADK